MEFKLEKNKELNCILLRPIFLYSTSRYDEDYRDAPWDNFKNQQFNLKNVTNEYGIQIIYKTRTIEIYIPRNSKCTVIYVDKDKYRIKYKWFDDEISIKDENIFEYFKIDN